LLLAKGADPNLARRDGRTPLAVASASGDQELVEMLKTAVKPVEPPPH